MADTADTSRDRAAEKQAAREQKQARREAAHAARVEKREAAHHQHDVARQNRGLTKRHAEWQARNDQAQAALEYVRTCPAGKRSYLEEPADLIEERSPGRTFVAGSKGFSIPVGSIGGHSVRARVGQTRGHSEAQAPVDTVIDSGTCVVTSTSVSFTGAKQTRVCDYKKIINIARNRNELTVNVSNRQKPTRIRMRPGGLERVYVAMQVAQADVNGGRAELIAGMEAEAARIAAEEPKPAV